MNINRMSYSVCRISLVCRPFAVFAVTTYDIQHTTCSVLRGTG